MSSTVLPSVAKPPNAGKGRVKGVPNKITADLKAMVLGALADAGGRKYLVTQAKENPTAFLTLVGKAMPKEVTGAGGEKLIPDVIRFEFVSGK